MSRRLSAHERALWSRVAATIRPLPGASPLVSPASLPAIPKPAVKTSVAQKVTPKGTVPAGRAAAKPVTGATLDGSWDRTLARGRVTPDRIIDLHDHSLERAHQVLNNAVEAAEAAGDRVLLIITGKGRADRPGRIRAELQGWLEGAHLRHRIAALRTAHPRHGGAGAFYLILRRPR